MSKQIELTLTKETKGTFVYASTDENPLITSLYLQKSQMPAEAPKKITVTVAFE
jgi:hypothetical protein